MFIFLFVSMQSSCFIIMNLNVRKCSRIQSSVLVLRRIIFVKKKTKKHLKVMNYRNGFVVILLVAISFIVIYFLPSSSFTISNDSVLTNKRFSYTRESSKGPSQSPVEEIVPVAAETGIHVSSPTAPSSSSPSSSIKEFQFPSYTSTSLELSLFPNHGSQISATSNSLFSVDHRQLMTPKFVFQTSYQKISCGAMMTNFCVWKGQPRYFRAEKKYFSSTGATKCCNEGETKFRFHSVMYDPIEIDSVSVRNGDQNQIDNNNNYPAPYQSNTIFIAPMCWEQYGYHLFLCLLNTWSLMAKLEFATSGQNGNKVAFAPKVKIGLLKSWSGENLLGSTTDWWDGFRSAVISENNSSNDNSANQKSQSVFWAWWSVVADHPSDVVDLASAVPSCFPFGIVAGKIDVITPGMQQQFRLSMLRRLGILDELERISNENHRGNKNTIRVTIIDRQKNFKLLNRDQIAKQFQEYYFTQQNNNSISSKNKKHPQVLSQVVIFENLPSLREQMRIAASTDVMVGMHGNGLTWSAFLNPGTSALVELWPSYIYNENYAHFAGRGNIKKWNVVGSGGRSTSSCPSSKRCNAEIKISNEIVKEVLNFVVATKIAKRLVYRGDEEYLKTQARLGAEKKMKKKSQ